MRFFISFLSIPVSLIAVSLIVVASLMAAPQDRSPSKGTAAKATENKGGNRAATRRRPKDVRMPGFSPEREAAAKTFLDSHHPELGRLLGRLKKTRPLEYKKAVRDIFRASERLTAWQDKNPNRYEVELKLWKLNSRIQLLAAKMRIRGSAAMKEELRQAILAYSDARTERLVQERNRLSKRVEKLDSAIEKARGRREQVAEQRLQQVLQGPVKLRVKKKAKQPTVKTSANTNKPSS